MKKWKVSTHDASRADALIHAGCRYMNNAGYPSLVELAAVIGIVKIEDEEPEDKPCTEE